MNESRHTDPVMCAFVVVSGLPAAGKTSLARPLAGALRLPLLDKDDILATLLDTLAVTSPDQRQRFSRASDQVLVTLARHTVGAVLCSFWRRERLSETSGTPTEWLLKVPGARVVEVFCDCPPAVAAARFVGRQRHPAQREAERAPQWLAAEFQVLAAEGPLGALGPVVRVDTTRPVDLPALVAEVEAALGRGGRPA